MLRVLWSGRSAMYAQQEKLDAISNNIANVNTEGYKRQDVSFQDLMNETLDRRGYPVNEEGNRNLIHGTGVKTGPWIRDNTQGTLNNTGSSTDFAIDGNGYFKVFSNDKEYYIRAGNFNLDNKGNLVDKNGNILEIDRNIENIIDEDEEYDFDDDYYDDYEDYDDDFGEAQRRTPLTKDNFYVEKDGRVYLKDAKKPRLIGKINVYDAVGENAFISVSDNLYKPVQGVNPEAVNSDVLQGYVERSNVRMEKEMSDMIVSQRAFEFSSRAVKAADEMWGMINNLRGR
ncbi:flagellar basal body protein [Clostridium tetani]|uniref:flagellar basal-body rod protein FlgG n=1 Tax=Clostridium tetani TaxID=1513 RepID=UPI000D2152B3|nr:flagellar basal-body rod protein FlgG [Clostridium tetani]AVP54185.1 flagellar basal body rod protein FlgG [Clostridium tetani]RXI51043.1 flagellar basal body rod protein FlgG [Clostridium tetani]RXI51097.1 flagellar basal body rod protein FlgG [Clostridium tetani]RXI76290.1 flagellar basal body rod protein FlgG [Clostridium tetani]RXM57116.1 flagellar basal body rod protein FlgG [Clostridium tetani]